MDMETSAGFVPAVETYLAEQASLLERAHERLAHRTLWWGDSGAPLTGEQIAVHAEAADRYVAVPNAWLPHATVNERTALYMAEHGCDELAVPLLLAPRDLHTALIVTQPSQDTRYPLQTILDYLIAASTGAPCAYHDVWDGVAGRTLGEVRGLLCAASAYARRYGPVAPASTGS